MDQATRHSFNRDRQRAKAQDMRPSGRAFLLTLDRASERRRRESIRKAARSLKGI